MKRSVFPLLILSLVLILPVLTGCPQDSGGGAPDGGQEDGTLPDGGNPGTIPSGHLGDDPLVLKGKVYRETIDQEGFKVTYDLVDTAPRVVEVYGGSEKLGERPLADGEFNISIVQPANLSSASADALAEMFPGWSSPKADPADVRGTTLYFRLQGGGGGIRKGEGKVSGDQAKYSFTFKDVTYLYVDKDVVITLGEHEILEGYLRTYKAAELELKKGWNALVYDQSGSGSGSLMASNDLSVNLSMYVGNPDLNWSISFYND
jgi:hypothetical protein